ncbi:MAG TPA: Rieske 2Fe-2S domain-containing protein [Phycisphaerae bacterium]|nr:Rieske 2Fe-2S domain-containing protein [Phycisphaerae bacterium]
MIAEKWIRLCDASECPPHSRRFVALERHELAVFHLGDPDRFVVIDNACPHAGGNLSAGEVIGSAVVCPWHEWVFSLDTGACTESEQVCVRKYECRVEGGALYARLED